MSPGPVSPAASIEGGDGWRGVAKSPTFQRFARIFCSVSGYFFERGSTNVLLLARPVRGPAGFFSAHIVALVTTTNDRLRLRFEPVGSITVRRRGRVDPSLAGAWAGVVAELVERAEEANGAPGAKPLPRGAFFSKWKASEDEFRRLR